MGLIYRPPNNNYDKFQDSLNSITEEIDNENKMCYLMGDFKNKL